MDDLQNIPKMKVADLKKHLKSKGLPVSGNKTELVERLQRSVSDDPDNLSAGGIAEEEDFDEEDILGDDDVDDDDDSSKISPQEEDEVLAGNLRIKDDSMLIQPEKKKITLKRSEPFLREPEDIPVKETNSTAELPMETEDSSANKENSEDEEPKKKVIRLSTETAVEPVPKIEGGTKKLSTTLTEEERRVARLARFGSFETTAVKSHKLSTDVGKPDVDKLKKRAERFGEITSKTLTKVDSLEKLKLRNERFGAATTDADKKITNNSAVDVKSARAARFGEPITAPATATATANGKSSASDEDIKQKRAERFANK